MKVKELVPLSDDVIVDSQVCNTIDYDNYEYLFPGSTIFKNEYGGNVFVFSGTPVADFNISDAFSFLTYSRKLQLLNMLKLTNELPVYYPNDEEVYMKCADMENGDVFCAIFNIGLDPIDKLELVCNFDAKSFEYLMPNGDTQNLDYVYDNGKYILDVSCKTLDPVIVFIHK